MLKKKINSLQITVISICVLFFLGGAIINLFWPYQEFSAAENRFLASKPTLTWNSLMSGEYGDKFETYVTDQFPLREFWVKVKAKSEYLLQKKENNGVYFGKNQTLIERFDQPDLTRTQRHIGYLNEFVARANLPVQIGFIPTAAEIDKGRLPALADPFSQEEYLDYILARAQAKESWLGSEIWQSLKENNQDYLYFRGDHHWSALGAFYFYQSLIEQMGFEPATLEDYQIEKMAEGFLGTLSAKAPGYAKADRIDKWTLVSDQEMEFQVEIPDSQHEGNSFFFPERLEERDHYTYYLDGNHALTILRNLSLDEGEKLLVVKDSYAHVLAPFLAPHFKEVQLLDLRYYNLPIDDFIAEEEFDRVLVLYSTRQFAIDGHIFKLSD